MLVAIVPTSIIDLTTVTWLGSRKDRDSIISKIVNEISLLTFAVSSPTITIDGRG